MNDLAHTTEVKMMTPDEARKRVTAINSLVNP